MKKTMVFLFVLVAGIKLLAQDAVTVRFTASTESGQYCPFDAVNVTNVTRGWTETLTYPDTVLAMHGSVGIIEHKTEAFHLGNAFPNPFHDETHVFLELPEPTEVLLRAFRVDGSEAVMRKMYLEAGTHRVTVSLSSSQMVFLSATTPYGIQAVKLLCLSSGREDAIIVGFVTPETETITQETRGEATGEFEPGDVMRYEAFLTDAGTTLNSAQVEQAQYDNAIIVLQFDVNNPIVNTSEPNNITQTTASCGGQVTFSGGLSVSARGVCWDTSPNPTLNNSHTTDGIGTGSFVSNIIGLTAGTTYYVRAYATNRIGTAYGAQKTFTTQAPPPGVELPTVSTNPVTDILETTAIGGGNVTADGGGMVTERGICWDISPNPTINNNYGNSGAGLGSYSINMTNLIANTTYYVRAYATNSVGTAYGSEVSFTTLQGVTTPSVITLSVTNITQNTAICGGNVFEDGGGFVTERGVCWSTSHYPTINNSHASNGSGLGSYSVEMTGLMANRTYYARAYATNSAGTAYGSERPFITELPTVTINVSANPNIGGTVSGGGDYQQGQSCTISATAAEDYSFRCWLENGTQISTNANYTFTVGSSNHNYVACFIYNGSGPYEYVDLGLPSGTLWANYNVGSNTPDGYGAGFAWGETVPKNSYTWDNYIFRDGEVITKYNYIDNLVTLYSCDDAATVNWGNGWRMPLKAEFQELLDYTTPTDTAYNGVLGMMFTASNGNSLFIPRGSYWSKSRNVEYEIHAWKLFVGSSTYSNYTELYYSERCSGLRVRPVRPSGNATLPTVTTDEVTNITYSTATCGGNVIATGNATVTERGICWSTNHNPTINHYHANSGVGIGPFTIDMSGLAFNTTYYVRAYAINSAGTAYGNEVSFTTTFFMPTFVDLGLPSGLLWATCNVGAFAPEEYGDYFAWGEKHSKNGYNWTNYQYCNGTQNTLTRYCNNPNYGYNGYTDNYTTLLLSDDAARANWGSEWRMPTQAEYQELYSNTTCTWTTINGVNGRLFTSSNGNSIFLPAAGSSFGYAGICGYYWSSSLYTINPTSGNILYFTSDDFQISGDFRSRGLPIRAVRSSSTQNYTITVSTNPDTGGAVSGGGTYQQGQVCTVLAYANNGYTFVNWTENNNQVSTNPNYTFTVMDNRSLVANFTDNGGNTPTGAINGLFTINVNGDQVYFSQGNLQYQASTNTWCFATNQWDIIGESNNGISPTYNGWIDLFGWGTSGYDHGAVCYQPWSTSTDANDYFAYGNSSYNLDDATGQADWGYNPISNGGNIENAWRTLSQTEWAFVFENRMTNSGIRYAKATVNGTQGIVLLPDNWNGNTYNLNATNEQGAGFSSNIISISVWTNVFETNGAVFLPLTGNRSGITVGYMWDGDYWSSSKSGSIEGDAKVVSFNENGIYLEVSAGRSAGFGVRLVQNADF